MAAYLIAQLEITDPGAFERYRAAVPAVVERFGGRYLVRGGRIHGLEGEWTVPRLVIIEFPDRDAAERFYRSEEYQQILPLRLRAAKGTLVIAEGI